MLEKGRRLNSKELTLLVRMKLFLGLPLEVQLSAVPGVSHFTTEELICMLRLGGWEKSLSPPFSRHLDHFVMKRAGFDLYLFN